MRKKSRVTVRSVAGPGLPAQPAAGTSGGPPARQSAATLPLGPDAHVAACQTVSLCLPEE